MLNRPTRALGTAALAVTLALGVTTPAVAHDGHDGGRDGGDGHSRGYDGRDGDHHGDGDHDGNGRWDDRDGDHDGWDGDRDGWDGDRDGGRHWGDRRWDGKDWSHERDGDKSHKSDRGDKATNAVDKGASSFADWQARVVDRLDRADKFLAGMADRIKSSDMDPAVQDAVLGAVQAYRAKIAELTSEAKAADNRKELRAVFGEYKTLYPRLFFGMGCNVKQARMTHAA